MKKLKIFGFLAVVGLIAFIAGVESAPSTPSEKSVRFLLNSPSIEGLRRARLGDLVTQKQTRVLRAHWDHSLQGGNSTAPIVMRDLDKVGDAILPARSMIRRVLIDTLTQPTTGSGSTASLSVGLTGGAPNALYGSSTYLAGNATSLVAATNAANYGTGGVVLDGVVTGTSTTMFKLQGASDSTVTINATTNSVAGGKLNVYIEYFTADE